MLVPRWKGRPAVLEDALDAEVDSLEMLDVGGYSQPGASPGRWHHLDPKDLDHQRVMSRVNNENDVALFKSMPPTGHFSYSPSDHLLARGSAWLVDDGEKAPLMEEANRIMGSYDGDVKAKGGVDWSSIGGHAFQPAPFMSRPGPAGSIEPHGDMRKKLDTVNSHVYAQPAIPVFEAGDRSYLKTDTTFKPTGNVWPRKQMSAEVWPSRMTKEDAAAVYNQIAGSGPAPDAYTIHRSRRQTPWVADHLDNANKYLVNAHMNPAYGAKPTEDAMHAYVAGVNKGIEGQNNAATNFIMDEYLKRQEDAARARVFGQTPKTAFGVGAAVQDQGYSKITFNRVDRTVPAAGRSDDGDAGDIREARIRRAEQEAAAGEAEDIAAKVADALQPLQSRIASVEASIAASSASDTASALPSASPAAAGASPGGKGLSLSVPGPIKMDHLELPGGEYWLQLGADAASGPLGTSASAPRAPSSAAPGLAPAVEGEAGYPEGVLDKRKDLKVDLDHAAVKQAAMDLQKKVVDEFEKVGKHLSGGSGASGAVAAAEGDDVWDSARDMKRGLDRHAMRAAASALQKKTVERVERPAAGDTTGDDVLDTSRHAAAHVDKDAMREAAEKLQKDVVSSAGSRADEGALHDATDDVLDSASAMDNGVDTQAVAAAAEHILQSTVGGGKHEASAAGDDVLDSATSMDTGVDYSAMKAAADGIMKATLGKARRDVAGSESDVLDTANGGTDTSVSKEAVAKAARAIEEEVTLQGASKFRDSVSTEQARGRKKSALAKEVERKLRVQHKHAKYMRSTASHRAGRRAAFKSRFQMLSDTMLMPINVVHDPSDTYLDPVGGTAHVKDLKEMYGSIERSDIDKQKMLDIKDLEDSDGEQPDILRPHDFSGGVGTKAHLHQVGNQIGAWYSSWWEHPNVEDLEEETQEMFGLSSDISGEPEGSDPGKRSLILKGLNVNGWEPGRSAEQVREDHLNHRQVSQGFWNDDLSQAEPVDVEIHHPCGSPLRKRPCDDEEGHTAVPQAGGTSPVTAKANRAGGSQRVPVNWDPVNRSATDPIWIDPVPLEVLCKGRANASWCPGEDDDGEDGEDESDADEDESDADEEEQEGQ